MITTVYEGKTILFYGLSTDTKPTGIGKNGSTFYEMDTKKSYMFDEENQIWIQQ